MIHGHTHVLKAERREGYILLNPGSVSIPKEDSLHSYMIYEDGIFRWKSLDGKIYDTLAL